MIHVSFRDSKWNQNLSLPRTGDGGQTFSSGTKTYHLQTICLIDQQIDPPPAEFDTGGR